MEKETDRRPFVSAAFCQLIPQRINRGLNSYLLYVFSRFTGLSFLHLKTRALNTERSWAKRLKGIEGLSRQLNKPLRQISMHENEDSSSIS